MPKFVLTLRVEYDAESTLQEEHDALDGVSLVDLATMLQENYTMALTRCDVEEVR